MKILAQSESELASYSKYQLGNGLTVIVAQRPHTRSFAMCMQVNAGMGNGGPHVAHLVEHLAMADMTTLSTRTDFLNAFTCFSKTRFHIGAHLDELQSGLKLMKHVMSPLQVDKRRVKNEIEILAREFLEAGKANLILNREHNRVLGGDKLARRMKKAMSRQRLSISADEAIAFHETYYQPANTVIAIVAPSDPGFLVDRVSETLGDIENSAGEAPETWSARLAQPRRRFHCIPYVGVSTICLWHKMLQCDFTDRVTLSFLNLILGESGRLFEELRTKNSLCYGVYSSLEFVDGTAWHLSFVNVACTKARHAARLLNEVTQSTTEPMSEKDFQDNIQATIQRIELIEEDKLRLVETLLNWNNSDSTLITPHDLRKATLELTSEQVASIARRFFSGENRHVLLIGGFGPLGFLTAKRLSTK